MPDETIFCPECRSKVKVPDTLLGQAVTCPLCRHTFTAPIRGGGSVTPAAPPPYVSAAVPEPEVASVVKTPATALLAVGVLGFAVNLFSFARAIALGPLGVVEQQEMLYRLFGIDPPPMDPDAVFRQTLLVTGCLVLIPFGVILGGWRMLQLRSYGLAVAGCVLAMLNVSNGCCLLGLPIGLWSLSVLLRPEVKASFQ